MPRFISAAFSMFFEEEASSCVKLLALKILIRSVVLKCPTDIVSVLLALKFLNYKAATSSSFIRWK